ncbi:hypothetical protein BH18THE1_BH18THE1_20840 [soil metagenome]
MNNKANDAIDEATRFLELVNKHLQEKNCKHTLVEVAKEFVYSDSNNKPKK